MNMMYELILAKKKVEEAALVADAINSAPPKKNKYEYDSDEEVEGGTWEHKQRTTEMEATRGMTQKRTNLIILVYFIGTFSELKEQIYTVR